MMGAWTGSRLLRGLMTAVAVLGIVAGSAIGLDEWADAVTTHAVGSAATSSQPSA